MLWRFGKIPARTESKGLDLPIISAGIELLSVEQEVDGAAFPALTIIAFRPRTVRSLPASKSSDGMALAVGSDRHPRLFADLDNQA